MIHECMRMYHLKSIKIIIIPMSETLEEASDSLRATTSTCWNSRSEARRAGKEGSGGKGSKTTSAAGHSAVKEMPCNLQCRYVDVDIMIDND